MNGGGHFSLIEPGLAVGDAMARGGRWSAVVSVLPRKELDRLGAPALVPGTSHLHLSIEDGKPGRLPRYLDRTIAFIDQHKDKDAPMLVHCAAGMSRSVAVVLGYLVHHGMSLEQAAALLQDRRPLCHPAPVYLDEIRAHFHLPERPTR